MDDVDRYYDFSDGLPNEFMFENKYIPEGYEDERWKYTNIENIMVSDHGRIYNLRTGNFLNGTPVGRCGHIDISVKTPTSRTHAYVHRLVAQAFVPNPHNYPIVRHLNDVSCDNVPDNLAWGTQLDNNHDMRRNGNDYTLTDEDREKAMQKRRKPIIGTNLVTGEKRHFESSQAASRILGYGQASISAVANGKRHRVGDWVFTKEAKND